MVATSTTGLSGSELGQLLGLSPQSFLHHFRNCPGIWRQTQRTNNILERFFRDEKRYLRKKTGMSSLNKILKSILADTLLVQNLSNEEYMKIILNRCPDMAERFSQIDAQLVQREMAIASKNNDRILPSIKKMIRDANLMIKLSELFCTEIAN